MVVSMEATCHRLQTLECFTPGVIGVIMSFVLADEALESPNASWETVVCFGASARQVLDSLGQALPELLRFPAKVSTGSGGKEILRWPHALRSLLVGGCADCTRWQKLQPLRAVRPATVAALPLQAAPQVSGASLCALSRSLLVVYGGRCSSTGETVGITYLVHVGAHPFGLVQWDQLRCSGAVSPPPRCYHGSTSMHKEQRRLWSMSVFGGAGCENVLHDDTWCLELCIEESRTHCCQAASWKPMQQPSNQPGPTARSSCVFTRWETGDCGLLHGGLGGSGVRSDVWTLSQGVWNELPTTGGLVARAHHCGAVHKDFFFVYSGQDATFLTVHTAHSLDLTSGTWHEVQYKYGPNPRIDAVAVAIDGIGVMVFGGVNSTFEFEPMDVWLLRGVGGLVGSARKTKDSECGDPQPRPHACSSLCAHGLQVYMFGGFDGHSDLDELWHMDFMPCSLRAA